MDNLRLFDGAPEVMHLQAVYVVPDGWRLQVIMRREGEHWSNALREEYSHLTSPELVDVVDSVLGKLLRIS